MTRKVALITGSTSGIGEAIARKMASAGFDVMVNSASSVAAGQSVAGEIGGAYTQANVARSEDVRRLVASTAERFGRIDVLINCAGTTELIPLRDLAAVTDEVWERILNINLLGTWRTIQAALPHLRSSKGSVVNISSIAGVRPIGSSIPYAVSKAAVNHLTRLLASVLGPEVRVNAIAPGLIDTPWTAEWQQSRRSVAANAPLKRVGSANDVAELVIALANSDYVTGEVVLVDGGLSLVSGESVAEEAPS